MERDSRTGPDDSAERLLACVKQGAAMGALGSAVGGVVGTMRQARPLLFAARVGIPFFTGGFAYSGIRQLDLARRGYSSRGSMTSTEKLAHSTISGGSTGVILALLFGTRANLLPGLVIFSSVAFGGQLLLNVLERRPTSVRTISQNPTLTERFLKSRFNPMQELSDEDYEKMLQEKLLRIETELALIDEDLEQAKREEHD